MTLSNEKGEKEEEILILPGSNKKIRKCLKNKISKNLPPLPPSLS
jgi:hypothetical protein